MGPGYGWPGDRGSECVRACTPMPPPSSTPPLVTLVIWGALCVPNPGLRFSQKYTEEVLSAADPSQPPPPPLQHFLEQPVERVQQYQALLKVRGALLGPPSPTLPCTTGA